MGGVSYTNPNRPYNARWWRWVKRLWRIGGKKEAWPRATTKIRCVACIMQGGHVAYVGCKTCARCGSKGRFVEKR